MRLINKELVREIIDSKEIEKFDEYLSYDLFEVLFFIHETEAIEVVYKRNKTMALKELIFRCAVAYCAGNHASDTVTNAIRLICDDGETGKLSLNNENIIYDIAQYSGNIDLFKILADFNIILNWGAVLADSCNFLQKETVHYLTENQKFSQPEIELALHCLINSSVASINNATQSELISFFVNKMNPDINVEGNNEWDYLFLECFQNSPDSAYVFYKDNFNTKIFETEDFWENLIEEYLESDEKNEYKKAFKDLKNSGLDISFIESVFAKENKTALFEELTK